MKNCIFCKIAKGEIKADIVARKDGFIAVSDIAPRAKVHIIAFPVRHIADSIHDKTADRIVAGILIFLREIAQSKKLHENGYRIVTNHGTDSGQTVKHIHFHLLGGEPLKDL